MMRSFALGLALTAAASCGGDEVQVNNSSPSGSVGGMVVDAATRAPLKDVQVKLIAGAQTMMQKTDMGGVFGFRGVPAGAVLLSMHLDRYVDAVDREVLPGAAGQFPTGNGAVTVGPLGLLAASSSFTVRVVSVRGEPQNMVVLSARTRVQQVDFSDPAGVARGELTVHATTDTGGLAKFTDLPDFASLAGLIPDLVTVQVPPFRVGSTPESQYDFPGLQVNFNLAQLGSTVPTIVLAAPPTGLALLASNVATLFGVSLGTDLSSVVASTDTLFAVFNLPIDGPSLRVSLLDELGAEVTGYQAAADGSLVKVLPGASVLPGREYNLTIEATGLGVGTVFRRTVAGPFFTRPSTTDAAIASLCQEPGGYLRVTFNEPVGTGNPGTNYLAGGNCALWFVADLNGSGAVGDYPGERGNPSCNGGIPFYAEEPDPPGPVGLSGFTTRWHFPIPQVATGPLGPGTGFDIAFGQIPDPSFFLIRVTGQRVRDFAGAASQTIPAMSCPP
ncbi:MAG TPA: hypothetical protein VKN99_22190 [Polyangia bacterium]|nr:hypothetical protein [Polyangia bacterium]